MADGIAPQGRDEDATTFGVEVHGCQKGIIIGAKGEALKKVGTWAREEMEKFFQKKVFLELFVKVNENWRTDSKALSRFGYQ